MPVITFILLFTTIEQVAIDVYLPSLPVMTDYFGVDASLLQATLSLYLLGFALSPLIFGPLCDRYGRRKIITIGIGIYCVSSFVCMITHSIWTLLLARLSNGIGSGAIGVANQAMARDSFTGVHLARVASYMSIAWSLIPIIAPAIGGYVQYYCGWRTNFALITAYGVITLGLLFCFLQESMQTRPVKLNFALIMQRYARFLFNFQFMVYVACTAISFAVTMAFNTAAPFLFQQQLGLSPVVFGWLALAVGCSYLLGTVCNNFLLGRFGIKSLLATGLILMTGCSFLMLFLAVCGYFSVISVSLPAGGVIFFEGFVYPNAAALAFGPIKRHTGIASALYGGIQLFACALTSALVAHLPETNAMPLSLVMFSLSCVLCIIYYFLSRNQR